MRNLLRIVYSLLYRPFAWTYDWVAAIVSCGQWQGWIHQTLPYLPGPLVVELGHGPGHLQVELLRRNIAAIGLDASPQMSRIARLNIRRAEHLPLLLNAYTQNVGLATACCDQMVATFPSEYIFDPCTLLEAHRLLKPGGRLIVLLGGWLTGTRPCQRLLGWLLRGPAESELQRKSEWLHPFTQAGFSPQTLILDLADSRVLLILASRD
jgi:SAM-dependent methyltransferase